MVSFFVYPFVSGNRDESGCLGQPKSEVTPDNTNSGNKGSGDTSKGQGKVKIKASGGTPLRAR